MSKVGRKRWIAVLLIIGFAALEFPGILIVCERDEPFIFGLPFLYGYVICGWMYMSGVLFYAYRTGWGKREFSFVRDNRVGRYRSISQEETD
ncbi:MAG: hypothetical protein Q4F96_05130 [Bacillota bacterium]|nr:hypothetical protein [Bacillota bacterium]